MTTPPSQPLPDPPQKLSLAQNVLVWFCVLLGVALCVLKALAWSRGTWNAEVSGYAIGAFLISFLIAYLIAGRKKARKPVRFGLIFVGLSFVLFLFEFSHPPRDPKTQVADLIREASGAKPVDMRGSFENAQDALLREVVREFLDGVKAHEQKAAALRSDLQALYSAASYSSPEAMKRSADAVRNVTQLDHQFVVQLEQWPAHVQQQVVQSHISDKDGFMKGFNETFTNSRVVVLRKQGDEIEAHWCEATLALYNFALAHSGQIRVKNEHVIIDDANMRAQFNNLLRESREQRKKMTDANTELAKLQNEGFQKFGLTKKDFGLDNTSPSEKH